jgi:hypothetical protein
MSLAAFRNVAPGTQCSLVANSHQRGDNRCMAKDSLAKPADSRAQAPASAPFSPGSMVVVTLGNPRDKFWGAILALGAEGLSLSGIELASFEDLAVMVKDGEPFTPAVVFFPMHRIERIELDLPDGNLPSLSQRFEAKTGLDPGEILAMRETSQPGAPQTTAPNAAVRFSKAPA